jgi:hypothetical protein
VPEKDDDDNSLTPAQISAKIQALDPKPTQEVSDESSADRDDTCAAPAAAGSAAPTDRPISVRPARLNGCNVLAAELAYLTPGVPASLVIKEDRSCRA